MISCLRKGKRWVVFAQGKRHASFSLSHVHRGAFFLSVKSQVPCVPIAIHGSLEAWPPYKRFPALRGDMTLRMGQPIYPSTHEPHGVDMLHEKVCEALVGLWGRKTELKKGTPL